MDFETGYWLGKVFTPSNKKERKGEGYNRFRIKGKGNHHLRMYSGIKESFIDGKLTFGLKYAGLKNGGGVLIKS